MAQHRIDRVRAQRLMREAGLDGLALFGPEAFAYATGHPAGVAAMWRRAGGAIALVPADPALPITAITSDLQEASVRRTSPWADVRAHRIWVDTVDLTGLDAKGQSAAELVAAGYRRAQGDVDPGWRPATFDPAAAFGLLRGALAERGLLRGRIGADLDFLPVADHAALVSLLPETGWADGSQVLRRLRAVKTAAEIDRLRRACQLAEAGLQRMVGAIAAGASQRDLSQAWRAGVSEAAAERGVADLSGTWDYIAVGPEPWQPGGIVAPGALIKADVGCLIDGYSSDSARTYVFGCPTAVARDVFAALAEAFDAGVAQIRAGGTLGAVHAAVADAMRAAGFPRYRRGHFGHGLGASVGSEEWPFMCAGSEVVIEPGMVLAFEVPFYARGLGALMIEDQILVTETGSEPMNSLPRELVAIE